MSKTIADEPPILGGMETIVEAIEEDEAMARDTLEEDVGGPLLPPFNVTGSSQTDGTAVAEELTLTEVRPDWLSGALSFTVDLDRTTS